MMSIHRAWFDQYPVLVSHKDLGSREIGGSGQDMCVKDVCILFLEGKVFFIPDRGRCNMDLDG